MIKAERSVSNKGLLQPHCHSKTIKWCIEKGRFRTFPFLLIPFTTLGCNRSGLGSEILNNVQPTWLMYAAVKYWRVQYMNPLCGPGPWTGFIRMWTGSIDPLFLLPHIGKTAAYAWCIFWLMSPCHFPKLFLLWFLWVSLQGFFYLI